MKSFAALIIAFILVACDAGNATQLSGVRSVYSGAGGAFEMTVELAENGDFRGETRGQDMWMLKTDGVDYFVIPDEAEPIVLEASIMGEVMRDVMPPEFFEAFDRPDIPQLGLEEAGEVTVNGRTGIGYRMAGQTFGDPPFVFSDDPELEPLKRTMAEQFNFSRTMLPIENRMFEHMSELLETGAPIRFSGADLVSYEQVTFEADYFELPAEPLDKEATREFMVARGMVPAEPMEMPELPELPDETQ